MVKKLHITGNKVCDFPSYLHPRHLPLLSGSYVALYQLCYSVTIPMITREIWFVTRVPNRHKLLRFYLLH